MTVEELVAGIPEGTSADALETALAPVFLMLIDATPLRLASAVTLLKTRFGLAKGVVLAAIKAEEKKRPVVLDEDEYVERLLTTGSDAEIGRIILVKAAGREHPLVHTEQEFWRYLDGVWAKYESAALDVLAHGLDGEICDDGVWKANQPRVSGAVKCARSQVNAPMFFDEAPTGIAFRNGFLHIADDGTSVFEPPSANHRVRMTLPWDYQPGAVATRWLQFWDEVYQGDPDAKEKAALIQQFVGACLVGMATKLGQCVVAVGEGANGKSTCLEVVGALFPANSQSSIPPQKFGHEYHVARLAGMRINIVAETPRTDMEHAENFKAIVTGDKVDGRHPAGRPFQFKPVAGHLFACNELPGTADHTHGFWRRFLPVTFNHVFGEAERDVDLAQKIITTEIAGVVNWALEGARTALAQKHYTTPQSVKDMLEQWRNDSDQVTRFANDKLELVDDAETGTMGGTVYKSYVQWAEENGLKKTTLSNTALGRRLKKLPGHAFKSTHTRDGERWNIKLKLHSVPGARTPYSR